MKTVVAGRNMLTTFMNIKILL